MFKLYVQVTNKKFDNLNKIKNTCDGFFYPSNDVICFYLKKINKMLVTELQNIYNVERFFIKGVKDE